MARYRQGRLNEEIRKSISNLLLNGIKDPALTSRIISVSGVEVTSDGSYATCYVTPLALDGEDKEEVYREVLAAFNRAKGTFRRQVGRDIKMRQVPELIFKLDTSMDYGRHIDAIIEEINQEERSAGPEGSAE
ncbi:MAG: 30S ribosome-binding factor RbfA [Mogibacterium sp.]|nr:30S ribosome-binding factor RbfA [Mogibacterium sp.]